jgi:hypothetical protein
MKGNRFVPPDSVLKELPGDSPMSSLAVLLEQYGDVVEMQLMDDGHVLVRFQSGESARKAVSAASGKKGKKLMFQGQKLHVIPKRKRNSGAE